MEGLFMLAACIMAIVLVIVPFHIHKRDMRRDQRRVKRKDAWFD